MDKRTLKSYLSLCREIEILQQERAELLNGGLGAVSNDGLPHGSGTSDPTAGTAARAAKITAELSQKLNECIDLRLQIEQAVQVAYEMNYSIERIWQLHGFILKKMQDYR